MCTTQKGNCPSEIDSLLQEAVGLSVKESLQSTNKILKEDSAINNYKVKYIFPQRLNVILELKNPSVLVKYTGFSTPIVLGEAGSPMRSMATHDLPTLLVEGEGKDLKRAIPLVLSLHEYYGLQSFTLDTNTLRSKTNDGITLVLPINKDLDILLGSVNLTLSQLNQELQGIRIEEVDFRYDNPVGRIKYE
jgi:hypothetical protein